MLPFLAANNFFELRSSPYRDRRMVKRPQVPTLGGSARDRRGITGEVALHRDRRCLRRRRSAGYCRRSATQATASWRRRPVAGTIA